ncbi:Ni/Co efflux regulator RcnB [Bradyrhizobium sp. USDA 377]
MKTMIIALSAAVVMATAPAVFAQGVSSKTPGQEMQQMGSKKGEPGASSYAPGHKKKHHAKASKKTSPGASSYAPGQTTGQTTGASTRPTTGGSSKSGY